jgi:hypothetical protein
MRDISLPHGSISSLRMIGRGKLVAVFRIRLPGVGWIDREYFTDDRGSRIDARSVKDSGGNYRRTVSLESDLRKRICDAVTSAIAKGDKRLEAGRSRASSESENS